jgi:hypothetical protein
VAVVALTQVTVTHTEQNSGAGDGSDGGGTVTNTETYRRTVTIWFGSAAVASVDYTDSPTNKYAVSAAADPYTGALCFNLLEFVGESTKASRSWLYIADDTGVRPLSQLLPGLPANAKVLSDNSLLSVV